ncbi:MAG: hypothetical protein ABIG03_03875 [Candidatus Eisenbacteria bacterium]
MSRTFAGILVGLLVLGTASVSMAGIPDPDASSVTLGPDAGMVTCPAGDGPAYEYILVEAKRADLTAIQGIPAGSFFWTITGGDVTITAVQIETDANGQIQFTVVGDETIVGDITAECQIYTVALNDSDLISCNSFDINEDNGVGVQDATLFVADYGTTAQRSDFNWDGGVGVQDATLFVAHYGH